MYVEMASSATHFRHDPVDPRDPCRSTHGARRSVVSHAALIVLLAGCNSAEREIDGRHVFTVEGFDQPESVQYDPELDVFYVSNVFGYGSVRDGAGYISWFDAGNPSRRGILASGGSDGVTLNAPKGLALTGDTLWVADIDVVRGFNRRTGALVAELDLSAYGAILLNSIAVGPEGTLYVTDTGIVMGEKGIEYPGGDKILVIERSGSVSILAAGPDLGHPNGIRWDPSGERLLVVSFHPFASEAYAVQPATGERTVLARGTGRFDGVTVLGVDRFLLTSWSDSSLSFVANGMTRKIVSDLWQPADLGFDTHRSRVAIPLVLPSRVEVWEFEF
jgi:sugar lactone lactonase YvrE